MQSRLTPLRFARSIFCTRSIFLFFLYKLKLCDIFNLYKEGNQRSGYPQQ